MRHAAPGLLTEWDRAALAVHGTFLEHGFVSVELRGTWPLEPGTKAYEPPVVSASADGSVSLQVLPAGWNDKLDSYTFGYTHPLFDTDVGFVVYALPVCGALNIRATSSMPKAEAFSAKLHVDPSIEAVDLDSVLKRGRDWSDKVADEICNAMLDQIHRSPRHKKPRLGEAGDTAEAVDSRRAPERVLEELKQLVERVHRRAEV